MFNAIIDRSRSFFDELDAINDRAWRRIRETSIGGVTRRRDYETRDYRLRHPVRDATVLHRSDFGSYTNALMNSGIQSDGWSRQSTIDSRLLEENVIPQDATYMNLSTSGYYQPMNLSSAFVPINSETDNFGNISPISQEGGEFFSGNTNLRNTTVVTNSNQGSEQSRMSVASNASTQPKIKDGAVNASMGTRRNLVTELDFGKEKVVDIFISPRFDCPLEALGSTNDTSIQLIKQYPFQDNHPFAKAYKRAGSNTEISCDSSAEISKIRLVAQETKITVTNATDDNDGWFEAVRLTPQKDSLSYGTRAQGGNQGDPYDYIATCRSDCFGNRDYTAGTEWEPNLSAKGSYVTGKLRNLHRYIWANKRVTRACEFKDLPIRLTCGTTAQDQSVDTTTNITSNVAFQDWDYDVIWIRVHGRPAPASTTAGSCCHATNLMIHLIQGVECVFGEQNMLHSYMTNNFTPYAGYESNVLANYSRRKKTYKRKSKRKYRKR